MKIAIFLDTESCSLYINRCSFFAQAGKETGQQLKNDYLPEATFGTWHRFIILRKTTNTSTLLINERDKKLKTSGQTN